MNELIIHADKLKWINVGDKIINNLLTDDIRKNLIKDNFNITIDNIYKYTNKNNIFSIIQILQQSLLTTKELEKNNVNELEQLALNIVLDLPEFRLVKESFLNNDLKFDCKIGKAELTKTMKKEQEEINLEFIEEQEKEISLNILIKRRFANLMIQGGAFYNFDCYNNYRKSLDNIDNNLIYNYNILTSIAPIGYFIMPDNIEKQIKQDAQAGSSEIYDKNDGIYTIKARGITLNYLIHEIIKGIWEWLSLSEDFKGIYANETIEQETRDILIAKEMYNIIYKQIPLYILPLFYKKILLMTKEDIFNLLNKKNNKEMIINIGKQIKQENKIGE